MPTFNTTNPKPGYIYDASDDTWYPLAGINPNQNLNDLGDVVISSASSGQIVVYDGTNWINSAPTAGDLTAVSAGTGISVTNGAGPIPSVAVDTTLVATTSNTMTLTNKTIALGSNTISGTLAEFNTAVTDADLVSLAGSETLTNKTLTAPIINITLNAQTATSYTSVLTDASKLVTMDLATANSFLIPTNASVAFPTGTTINVIQIGAGQTKIVAATTSTTTVNSTGAASGAPLLRARYSAASCIKVATDTWYVVGDIS